MKRRVLIAVGTVGLLTAGGCSGSLDYEPSAYLRSTRSAPDAGVAPTLDPPDADSDTVPADTNSPDAAPALAPEVARPEPEAGSLPPEPSDAVEPDAGAADTLVIAASCADKDALAILVRSCGNCHGGSAPTLGLDLVSPGVAQRLVAVQSRCDNREFLELGSQPVKGYFLEKLLGPVDGCGSIMPFAAEALTRDEISCLFNWSEREAAAGPSAGGVLR
jgi:hypothetical protein